MLASCSLMLCCACCAEHAVLCMLCCAALFVLCSAVLSHARLCFAVLDKARFGDLADSPAST